MCTGTQTVMVAILSRRSIRLYVGGRYDPDRTHAPRTVQAMIQESIDDA